MSEAAWEFEGGRLPRATLGPVIDKGPEKGLRHLRFECPKTEDHTFGWSILPVTEGDDAAESRARETNVWKIVVSEDGRLATTTPSIHYVDHFHSPFTTTFELVDEL